MALQSSAIAEIAFPATPANNVTDNNEQMI